MSRLCDHSAGSSALVSPGWWQDTDSLVVSAETVDSRLDKNQTELGVLVFSVALEMLADGNSLIFVNMNSLCNELLPYLLDQHVEILWDFWGKT